MSLILPSEAQWFLSNPNATSGFSGTGNPYFSNGKFMSTTQINETVTLDNLFDNINGYENAALQVDYQCLFLANNTSTGHSMRNPVVWSPLLFYKDYTSTFAIGSDPISVVIQTSITAQAQLISSPTVAPANVTNWTQPSATLSQGLKVADIPPGYCIALWIRRTATNQGPTPTGSPDGGSIQVTFDSDS